MSGIRTVLNLLPTLDRPALEKVKQRLDLLLGEAAPAPPVDAVDSWLLDAIENLLVARGMLKAGTLRLVVAGPKFDRARRMAQLQQDFLTEKFPVRLTRAQKDVLGYWAAVAMAALITEFNAPVAVRTMLVNLDKVPEAMECSFPGYLASQSRYLLIREREVRNGRAASEFVAGEHPRGTGL